ncbi:DUF1294 domain-containing protein [Erysipelotrichaceae bacterium Oil+RF-744-GAM-WT-6]|mgnify:CR=1 FL=1|uniref:DUF1294 domain-containing protein n=1 Tax=Stecheria intestinalis TaxID=2606630 RepID=A0A7X2NR14_9FIRM|nr:MULTISPECIES: DUF1294 domain-containing protein [Erysipelotrichaceae]MCI2155262.1 DUF1294 domain-containing protein [Solobacterium sp.]MDY4682547.1 DUF1294 domain-containing protein [Lachnospiraceae bacterium]MCI6745325.1 DUF1294 domain-containing protein [Anaerolactibacter massiliensis]MDD5882343.1 DUF1294 domain-containing protein [Stecheria intestinalis]MDD6365508.1 DUF1294 domain-containing protein [Stecheria intestinalis]
MSRPLAVYLIAVSLVSFALFGIDKQKAVHHAWRIPERVLILSAIAGGSIGALLGMGCFHHKTRKPLFSVGIPVILCLQVLILLKADHII